MGELTQYMVPSILVSLLIISIITYLLKKGKMKLSEVKPIYDVRVDITNNNKIRLTTYSGNRKIKEFKANGIAWAGMTAQEMAEKLASDWNFTLRNVVDKR